MDFRARPSRPVRAPRPRYRLLGLAAAALTTVALSASPAALAAAVVDPTPSGVEAVAGAPLVTESNGIVITAYSCEPGAAPPVYTVPDDVHSLYIEVVGGEGQTPDPSTTGLGGLGGQVTGGLNVRPGDTFTVHVGCAGTSDGGYSSYAAGGAKGVGWAHLNDFFTVFSYGYDGGGGGGASALVDSSGAPVAVGGGGGGAGGDAPNCINKSTLSESGGAFFVYCGPGVSTEPGGDGGDGAGEATDGGAGANNTAGPTPDGVDCSGPVGGGAGANFQKTGGGGAGGGGGGGYNGPGTGGGCGGASGQETIINNPSEKPVSGSAGGGGGGGTSFAGADLRNPGIDIADDSGDGYVLILSGADGVRSAKFPYSGKVETFCVPDGVNEIYADLLGGSGGGGGHDFPDRTGTGGGGSGVQVVLPVVERTLLQITAGQYGYASGGFGDGRGGHRGTSGSEGDGAGGGGSSAIKQSTSECVANPDPTHLPGLSYLAVAGGGGGGGGYADTGDGGDGGTGAAGGNDGEPGGDPNGGAGGCGGLAPGQSGCETGIHGGHGTEATDGGGGGGGGGGYDGGGKGHGAQDGDLGGGGGGGGGNSWVTPSAPEAPHYYTGHSGERANEDGENDGHVELVIPVPTTRSAVSIVSGNQQTATPGAAFAEPLVFEYVDAITGPTRDAVVTVSIPEVDGRLPATIDGATGDGSTIEVTTDAAGRASVALTVTDGSPVGAFSVTAVHADDPAKLIKSASFSLFAVAEPTTLTVSSDATVVDGTGYSVPGEAVTFTAAATETATGDPLTSGTVQFSVDGTDLGAPVDVDETGTAVSPPWSATLGQHHVLATYVDRPGGTHATTFASYSAHTLPVATPDVSLTASSVDLDLTGSVTFTIAVELSSASPWVPGGTVQLFRDDNELGAPLTLDASGSATSPVFTRAQFGDGKSTVSAAYSGDTHFAEATSDTVDIFGGGDASLPDPGSEDDLIPRGAADARGGGLAATGTGAVPSLLGAVVLLLAGGALLVARRPERRHR